MKNKIEFKKQKVDFEEFLQEEFMKDYIGCDDDAPDCFDAWIEDLSLCITIKYAEMFAIKCQIKAVNDFCEQMSGFFEASMPSSREASYDAI